MPRAERSTFQIVEVISECRLLDALSHEHLYWRRDGTSLSPGFYVVNSPASVSGREFYQDALFHGPFYKRVAAKTALKTLEAMIAAGRIAEGSATDPVLNPNLFSGCLTRDAFSPRS